MKPRALLLGVAIVSVAIALFVVRPHSTPGPLLRDFEAYQSGAIAWSDGRDPYGRDVWNAEREVPGVDPTRDEVLPFVGPPQTLLVFASFARMPYAIAARAWSAILGAALVATVLLALRLARARFGVATLIAGFALAVGFAPVTSDLALGQVALLAYAGALLAVVALERPLLVPFTGAFLALLQPNVALALAVLFGKRRGVVTLMLAGAATLVAAAAAGIALLRAYPSTLAAHGAVESLLVIQQTPAAIAYGFGFTSTYAHPLGYAVALAALVYAILSVRAIPSIAGRFAFACALVPFVSSFFHEHDLLVAFAPAVWCARFSRGRARALALFATLLVAVDWLGLAQRPDGIAQSALLAFAACCAFVALGDDETIPWRGALAAGAAIACGALVARAHPAPIWPDAMGAFHAAKNATIAAVWGQEQQQSGLAAQNAWWAALRSLGLAGCALLAYGVRRTA